MSSGNQVYLGILHERKVLQDRLSKADQKLAHLQIEHNTTKYILLGIYSCLLFYRLLWDDLMSKIPTIVSSAGSGSSRVSMQLSPRVPLLPLEQNNFPNVRFWHYSDYKKIQRSASGHTVVGGTPKVRGRPKEILSDDELSAAESYPWLEDEDGQPMSKERLKSAGKILLHAFRDLVEAGIAPESWTKASSDAYEFIRHELGVFIEFRLCSDNWKAEKWVSKRYSSWSGKPTNLSSGKRKRSISVIPKQEIGTDGTDASGNFKILKILV